MDILHYIWSFLPVTCNWVYPQVTRVPGCSASVLCHQRENEEAFPFGSVHITPTRPITRDADFRLQRRVRYGRELRRCVCRLGPNVIHAHFGREAACILPTAEALQIPLVTSFYGFDLGLNRYPWFRRRYRRLFRYGALFLCEGPFAQRQLVALGCPEDKCRVLRLGVDLDQLPYRPRPADDTEPVRVLIASSFREKKAVHLGVAAFAACANRFPGATLTIIGDGPLRPAVEQAVADSGCAERIRLLGYQPHEVFLEHLYQAQVFLAPSITAPDGDTEGGSPVSLTEAAASGIPIVSTFHADIPEVVLHEQTGLLVPEKNTTALSDYLLRLLISPALRQEMGFAGRKWIERRFTRRQQLERLARLYRDVLTESSITPVPKGTDD